MKHVNDIYKQLLTPLCIGLTAVLRAQCSPQPVRADRSRLPVSDAAVHHGPAGRVSRFDRVGDEHDGPVAEQPMRAAGMLAAGRHYTGRRILQRHARLGVGRENGVDGGVGL